jgi:hypothetical protein
MKQPCGRSTLPHSWLTLVTIRRVVLTYLNGVGVDLQSL